MNAREMLVFLSAFAMFQTLNTRYSDKIQYLLAFIGLMTLLYILILLGEIQNEKIQQFKRT